MVSHLVNYPALFTWKSEAQMMSNVILYNSGRSYFKFFEGGSFKNMFARNMHQINRL